MAILRIHEGRQDELSKHYRRHRIGTRGAEKVLNPNGFSSPSVRQRRVLAEAVTREVQRGNRVESQSDYQAVLVSATKVNHLLHLILSIITAGLWIPIWLLVAVVNQGSRTVLTVDENGNLNRKVFRKI